MTELNKLRVRGVMYLAVFGWGCTVSLLLLALLFDLQNELMPILLSAARAKRDKLTSAGGGGFESAST